MPSPCAGTERRVANQRDAGWQVTGRILNSAISRYSPSMVAGANLKQGRATIAPKSKIGAPVPFPYLTLQISLSSTSTLRVNLRRR
jgi:hypothetical protein